MSKAGCWSQGLLIMPRRPVVFVAVCAGRMWTSSLMGGMTSMAFSGVKALPAQPAPSTGASGRAGPGLRREPMTDVVIERQRERVLRSPRVTMDSCGTVDVNLLVLTKASALGDHNNWVVWACPSALVQVHSCLRASERRRDLARDELLISVWLVACSA